MVAPLVNISGVSDSVATTRPDAEVLEGSALPHQRRYRRQPARDRVVIRFCDLDGRTLRRGTARLGNVTPVGAFLTRLSLDEAGLPLGDFRITLRVVEGDHLGLEAVCRPVRARFGVRPGLGVAFVHLRVSV